MRIPELKTAIAFALDHDKPVWIWGAPGIGKSQAVAQVAHERGAALVDIRLSMFDPVDLRGLPAAIDGETVWLRPGIWPKDESRETILFFDELDRAAPAVLGAAMQIVLDRRIGEHELPSNVRVIAAGNGKTDRHGTNRVPLALANRFTHLDVVADPAATRDHFNAIGLAPEIVAFLHLRPNLVETESTDGRTFATPRQWETVASFLDAPERVRHSLISGAIGADVAGEFAAFCEMFRTLPPLRDILADPDHAPIPSDPSGLYAVTTAVARAATHQNVAQAFAYLRRLPAEFSAMGIIDAVKRDESLKATASFTNWAATNKDITL